MNLIHIRLPEIDDASAIWSHVSKGEIQFDSDQVSNEEIDELLKTFNPAEPRDGHGRWTTGNGGSARSHLKPGVQYTSDTSQNSSASTSGLNVMNVDNAIKALHKGASNSNGDPITQSGGRCAHFVNQAIQSGGISLQQPYPGYAKDYGDYLGDYGFTEVPSNNYQPQKRDVVVIQPYAGAKKPYGHIAMWDGDQWVSDYFQPDDSDGSDPYPGSHYRNASPPPSYVYYRPQTQKP